MKIALFAKSTDKQTLDSLDILLNNLQSKHSLVIEKKFIENVSASNNGNSLDTISTFENLDETFNLLISLGGDGTILRAVSLVKDLNIPIVGINTGRLGFLANIQPNEINEALNEILDADFKISERTLITVTTSCNHNKIKNNSYALNEVAVSRKNTTSMININTKLNGEYLNSYWADGLIIATPTGSTGYSLSCGGPVISSNTPTLAITPIAPHNLNARPIIISDDTEIKLKVDGRESEFLMSLDSRIITLKNSSEITIKKAPFKIKMIELHNKSFISTLRKKLLWGKDKRN